MVFEKAGKEFGHEFGENFASGAGQQLALGVSESTLWLGGSIISASMWHGAYRVLSNPDIGRRRLWFAMGLPAGTTFALFGYAIAMHWLPHSPILHAFPGQSQNPQDRQMRAGGQPSQKKPHSNDSWVTGKQPQIQPDHDDGSQEHRYYYDHKTGQPKIEEDKPQQKWYSRWLFGQKPKDSSVEKGESLKASGYGREG